MALAISSVIDDKAIDYVQVEPVDESYRRLGLEDIDPKDVILFSMMGHGLDLKVPPSWLRNGHKYWSETIDGLYLQRFINFKYPVGKLLHRAASQGREMRDDAQLSEALKDLFRTKGCLTEEDIATQWRNDGDAERFSREYDLMFRGPDSLWARVHGNKTLA